MLVALSVAVRPLEFSISKISETMLSDPDIILILSFNACSIIFCAMSVASYPEISSNFLSYVPSRLLFDFISCGRDFQNFLGFR